MTDATVKARGLSQRMLCADVSDGVARYTTIHLHKGTDLPNKH